MAHLGKGLLELVEDSGLSVREDSPFVGKVEVEVGIGEARLGRGEVLEDEDVAPEGTQDGVRGADVPAEGGVLGEEVGAGFAEGHVQQLVTCSCDFHEVETTLGEFGLQSWIFEAADEQDGGFFFVEGMVGEG